MRRQWIVPALMALAVVGGILIVTADETQGVALEEIVTEEGLATQIPVGWVATPQFPFDFVPPGDGKSFDQWTIARACPVDGCAARSLDEWLALAPDLPTFVGIDAVAEGDLFNVEVQQLDDGRIVRATTATAARLVFVAVFADGADDYVACSVRLGVAANQQLADAIVDVCRSTQREAA